MSSIINFVYNISIIRPLSWVLNLTGLFKKKANLLLIGLDNSGKTTFLGLMANNRIMCYEPTYHPNKEELSVENFVLTTTDIGGHVAARRLWKSYHLNTDGVIFMVDSTDYNRMLECRDELNSILSDSSSIPVLVLGNKIDSVGACSKEQLSKYLCIENNYPNVKIFMCSVVNRSGLNEALKWLTEKL
jgi:GTP-binding protein SAR1